MKVTVDECYELEGDYQNQFLGVEVFPKPKYQKLKEAERSVNKVHYNDVYILQPGYYYYITFQEDIKKDAFIKIIDSYFFNGLIPCSNNIQGKLFLCNFSKNNIYLQKGTQIGVVIDG